MNKTFKWLDEQQINFSFHDYKKEGVPIDVLEQAINEHGWENVINRRGTTWRKLSEETKNEMNDKNAIKMACENASTIKRPLTLHQNQIYLGFNAELYQSLFPKNSKEEKS